jgi:hypothetical protein
MACGVLAGLVESMLIPLYAGRVLVPLAPALAVLSNIALPWLGRYALPRTAGAVAPYLAWLLVVAVLFLYVRPEGDVIYPGGHWLQWCSYGVVLGGTFAGAVTVFVVTSPRDLTR